MEGFPPNISLPNFRTSLDLSRLLGAGGLRAHTSISPPHTHPHLWIPPDCCEPVELTRLFLNGPEGD